MLALVTASAIGFGLTGCASTWETVSSKRFREKPWESTFGNDDPMHVLRTSPDGEERAAAMRRLKEPLAAGKSQAEQDEAYQILAEAATADPSPWVRMAAIDALGKFRDPRAVETLALAFHQAPGRPTGMQPATSFQSAGGRSPTSPLADRLGLHGPQGFPADQTATIRGRALDALAATGQVEAIDFLARIAEGQELANEDPTIQTFVRQRAVAGLGKVRQKEAVSALTRVLEAEQGKDITLTNLAHGGLVELTGKNLPADPGRWNEVVQTGFEIAPESNAIQRAIGFRPE